jgi:hypothetical protein
MLLTELHELQFLVIKGLLKILQLHVARAACFNHQQQLQLCKCNIDFASC